MYDSSIGGMVISGGNGAVSLHPSSSSTITKLTN